MYNTPNMEKELEKLQIKDRDGVPEWEADTSDSYTESSDENEFEDEVSPKININQRKNFSHANVPSGNAANKAVKAEHTQVTRSEQGEILVKYSDKIRDESSQVKSARIEKDKSDRATVENAIDPKTFKQLNKFIKNGTLTKIDGCLSTGKEANIYYGVNETTGKEYAIKVYKTSVLVFKDRERYISGEFRFKSFKNSNKINARKLIKVWSEKEFRNLKRLKANGFNVPEPFELKSNILMMEFLSRKNDPTVLKATLPGGQLEDQSETKGWPAPKLKDYEFENDDEIIKIYKLIIVNMRLMYQKCKLIHADLSEYNLIMYQKKIYIIDVSQSIEPTHPMALDFLRMDIKNINDYFTRKKKIPIFMEKEVFKFVTEDFDVIFKDFYIDVGKSATGLIFDNSKRFDEDVLSEIVEHLLLKQTEEDEKQDEIFRSLYLMRDLNSLEEGDFVKFNEGEIDVFKSLVAENDPNANVSLGSTEQSENADINDSEEGEVSDSDSDDNDDIFDKNKPPKGKKYEDKEQKKLRKQQVKEQKQEKRKTKMKKHVKQKIIKKTSKK